MGATLICVRSDSARLRRGVRRSVVAASVLLLAFLAATSARAQESAPAHLLPASPAVSTGLPIGQPADVPSASARGDERQPGSSGRAARVATFLAGAGSAFALHEGGHLLFDVAFGVTPVVRRVDFGGIPFFAISHEAGLPPRQEFVISSAGFWMQHLSSEIILTRRPRLSSERAPFRKGMLAFNVLASIAYGAAALAHAGPSERDTRGMAASLRVDEAWMAPLLFAPALLDAWRYAHPDSRWATWLSRGVKVGSVVLVVRAGS